MTTTLDPRARTTAIRALQTSIEDDLHHIGADLDSWVTGDRMALREARDTVATLRDHLDALEQLGPPTRRDDH